MTSPSAATEKIEALLTCIRLVARHINLYTFELPDGGVLPPAEPGAHVGLRLPSGLERQYSLVESSPQPTSYTVAVKRDAASRGGSRWIHDNLRVGMTLAIEPPRNNFPLNENAERTVLIAGGIGIAPIFCMAKRLEQLGRNFQLYYACRSRSEAAFLCEIACRPNVQLHFDEESEGQFLDIGAIVSSAPVGSHLYCCGPAPMLKAFEAATGGRSPDEIHVEYFTQKFEAAKAGGFVVELARSGRTLQVPEGESILHALLKSGIDVPHSCEEGLCGACETKVLGGTPDHRDSILTEGERAENTTMMICCSGAKSPKLILDL